MSKAFEIKEEGLNAKKQFKSEVARWAVVMKVKPAQIRIQRMTKKWASCSSGGRVCFSSDLLKEKRAFQEFVIVHELLHLQAPNHGKLFKSLMNAYLPGWEAILTERNESGGRSLALESTFVVKIEKRETIEQKPA
jgi:predicted metal-dependent hydrolase